MHIIRSSRLASLALLALLAIVPLAPSTAQDVAAAAPTASTATSSDPKVLTLDDYGRWNRITSTQISPDGRWMTFAYAPNEGDATLHIRSLDGDTDHTALQGSAPAFSDDSRWVAYITTPPEKEQERLRRARKPIVRTLQLRDLRSGATIDFPDVQSFRFSRDARWLVMRKTRPEGERAHTGTDMLVRDLASGVTRNIGNVSAFAFDEDETLVAYTIDAADRAGNGLYLLDPRTGVTTPLATDTLTFDQLSWNRDGSALAVLRGAKHKGDLQRTNTLLVITAVGTPKQQMIEYAPGKDATFPKGMVLSEFASLAWSRDGARIFLGLRPQEPEPPKTEEPQANVDVWHWADEQVQSVQQVRANQERRFTYAAAFNLAPRTFVRLADDDMRSVPGIGTGRFALGRLDKPYRLEVSWGGSRADYYRVDALTGDRKRIATGLTRTMGTSPDGRWFLYLKDGALIAHDLESGATTDLSKLAGTSFVDETDDHPYEKPSYGVAGWAKDGRTVIVNHRFDLWALPLAGGKAVNLTRGVGDREQIQFRVVRLADDDVPEEDRLYLDTTKPLVLSAYGHWTKKSGYYELRPGGSPTPLIWEDRSIGSLAKARKADRVIFTRQTFTEFPDYHVADARFGGIRRITEANPHLREYAWGRRVLVDYTNSKGQKLQATLTLPAGYDPAKKYPMIVYFYETMSERHHQFSMPVYDDRPHMSTYASDGYLVLMPDVVYEIGKPGTSALDCVSAAVNKVIELGYADPKRVGLQGHSWGGYQSSFIVTQTDMFAAVVTGAPPTNLVSFYNELYRSTGTVQQGITELGQVRMGTNPWANHELYMSQSPVHQAENIRTPFLILHGTEDGAVDWRQGLEFYNAARRLGKNVILLSYPGEAHHLGRRENQKDFQIRMKQYFDHYLKGAPAPRWMTDGVPHLRKGEPPAN